MLGGMVENVGTGIQNLWGSDSPPKAILNRYAAKTAKGAAKITEDLTSDVNKDAKAAFERYQLGQPKAEQLAQQQEGVLGTLRDRRLNADPNALLQQVGNTAFGFINPNVVNPLAKFDVNSSILASRARGVNPAAVDSTAERLRNARIASGRYYDVARDAYNQLPGLFNSAYAQGQANDAAAAGYNPAIMAAYDAAYSRPTQGIMNRIKTSDAAVDTARKGIQGVLEATQGYKQPENFWDKLGKTGQQTGQQMQQDEARMLSTIASIAGSMGSAEGGGGGGGGGGAGGAAQDFLTYGA